MKFRDEYKAVMNTLPDEQTADRIKQKVLRETKKKKPPIAIAAVSAAGTLAAAAVLLAVIVPKMTNNQISDNTIATGQAQSETSSVYPGAAADTNGFDAGLSHSPEYAVNDSIIGNDVQEAITGGTGAFIDNYDNADAGEDITADFVNSPSDNYSDDTTMPEAMDKSQIGSSFIEPLNIEIEDNGNCKLTDNTGNMWEYENDGTVTHFVQLPETETATDSDNNSFQIFRDGNLLYIFDESMDNAACYTLLGQSSPGFEGNAPSYNGEN